MLFALAVVEVLVAVVAAAAAGLSWSTLLDLFVVTNTVIGLSLAVAGWPIAVHRPRNPVGWSLLAGGCCYLATAAGITALAYAVEQGWQGPLWRVIATVANGGWPWAIALFIPLALLLFPDGRLPGRRWSWLAILMACNGLLFSASGVLSPQALSEEVGVGGYLTWWSYPGMAAIGSVAALGILISYAGALLALIVRYRRGSEQVRRQLLWVVLALIVVFTVSTLDTVLGLESLLSILPIPLVPLSISVAVLRYQVLDIRLVVSRSVLYALLTAGVIGAYLGAVTLLDQTLRRQVSLGSSVLATLAIAVAFNPARMWLQRHVDRAFYGARQDPVRAVAEVGARLGDVGTPTGTGLASVLQALCDVMRFPSAAITVADEQLATYGEPSAVQYAIPLRPTDEQFGDLVVGLRTGESRLSPSDEQVLVLLAAPVAVAVQAYALAEELQRSRERVISGREEERRRLRRDLHDGLGPILTGVVLNAEAARALLDVDPQRSAALLGRLQEQTIGAIEDIRRLVDDLRPPALDGLGLIGALREHAVVLSRHVDGTPLQVTFDAASPVADLPAAVEVATYRIVTEALTNVARHSDARHATVTLAVDDHALHVGIHDDGSNVEGWQAGVGLTSIRERVTELGGHSEIRSDAGGFHVDLTLPVSPGDAAGPQPAGLVDSVEVPA